MLECVASKEKRNKLTELDRWLSCTATIGQEFAWADSVLVVVQRWWLEQV